LLAGSLQRTSGRAVAIHAFVADTSSSSPASATDATRAAAAAAAAAAGGVIQGEGGVSAVPATRLPCAEPAVAHEDHQHAFGAAGLLDQECC
jgi:hypothetical protein